MVVAVVHPYLFVIVRTSRVSKNAEPNLFADTLWRYQHANHLVPQGDHSVGEVAHPRYGTWASSRNNNGVAASAFAHLVGGFCVAFEETRRYRETIG